MAILKMIRTAKLRQACLRQEEGSLFGKLKIGSRRRGKRLARRVPWGHLFSNRTVTKVLSMGLA